MTSTNERIQKKIAINRFNKRIYIHKKLEKKKKQTLLDEKGKPIAFLFPTGGTQPCKTCAKDFRRPGSAFCKTCAEAFHSVNSK